MSFIDDLIKVAVSVFGGGISKASFSVGSFASFHPWFTDRIKFYGDTTAVAADFPTTSQQYLASVAYFSQTPSPSSLAISRLEVDAITVDVVGGAVYDDTHLYSIDINGNGPYTSTGAGSAILTATALVAAATADPDTDWTDNADGTYDIDIKASPAVPAPFVLTSIDTKQNFIVKTEGESWTDGLIAIKAASNSWYGLGIASRVEADVLLTAAWAQTNKKLFGTFSNDLEIINTTPALDTGSIAKQLQDLGYTQTFSGYHSKADGAADEQWIDMAFFGENLTVDLDLITTTWGTSSLVGITSDDLTDTQTQNATGTAEIPLDGKHTNIYIPLTSVNNTIQRGMVCAGEWIDTVTGINWTEIRSREGALAVIISAKQRGTKIPFTDPGLAIIPGTLSSVFKTGQNTNFLDFDPALDLAKGYSVTWPAKADIPQVERNARIQKNIVGIATLAGAIQATSITVSVGV